MNWKEEFVKSSFKALSQMGTSDKGFILNNVPFEAFSELLDKQEHSISTQLEKLIDTSMRDTDRVYINNGSMFTDGKNFKKTLKAKWLI